MDAVSLGLDLPPAAAAVQLIELSAAAAPARFSLALHWLLRAQRRGEPCAWIQPQGRRLYPPDLQRNGVDLEALLVVQVAPAQGALAALRAAEIVLRSGAFGLLGLDFRDGEPARAAAAAWQGRLLRLMRQHRTTVVVLTAKAAAAESLGPLCSLRLQPQRRWQGRQFYVDPTVLKNKAGLVELPLPRPHCGPAGLGS